ncbi:scaffold protein [Salinivibrio phage CW02]|uniref:Scaffold protein n=1 Tax=Salinivibrio phage CW02 TaxID=1161935 RepID=H9D1H3_9CAUD|nr:scaffold protein [Salinivibrio phage CW02]AFE86215.1 scaffold protein [Salinivibrio phage CW02]
MFGEDKEKKLESGEEQTSSTAPQQEQEGGGAPSAEPHNEPFADLLGTIVNDEGKPKYKSVPEAFKGLTHAQSHIQSLEQEKAALEAELQKRASVEETVQSMTQQQQEQDTPSSPGLTEEAVQKLLEQQLENREKSQREQSNKQKVAQTLKEKFGDEAEKTFYSKAEEFGMPKEQLEQLAATSPDAVLSWFGAPAKPVNPSSSSVNTTGLQPRAEEVPTMMDAGRERINLPRGEKSMLLGASSKDQASEMQRHKEAVYAKYGIKL